MKFERVWTGNWENAFRGLRHPMESYSRSDSYGCITEIPTEEEVVIRRYKNEFEVFRIGENDMHLAQRMIKAGSPNDKFLRQIFVSVDITAPEYFWSQLDTYKVGTVANSTSKMHKLATTPITLNCFEIDDMYSIEDIDQDNTAKDNGFNANDYNYSFDDGSNFVLENISFLEELRQKYNETKDKRYWKELIRWLPESWLQTRTWTANYAVLRNIIHWRRGHRLSEWNQFIDFCKKLPYADKLLFYAQGKVPLE